MSYAAAAVAGYLLGSIPVGYLMGLLRGVDVRKFGSGATGGTNVLRTLGWGPALITGVMDLLKGVVGAYLGLRLAGPVGYALGGLGAVLGHSYPVWLRFRGGKSVATGAGVLLVRHPLGFPVALAAGLLTIFPTRYVSLGSIVAGTVYAGLIIFSGAHPADKWLAAGALLVVMIRHKDNMKRLASGTENKVGQKAKPKDE